MWSSSNQASYNGVTSPTVGGGGGAPLGPIHPNTKHLHNHSSSSTHHVSSCSSSTVDPNNSLYSGGGGGGFNTNTYLHNSTAMWGNASTHHGLDGSVRVWRDGSSVATTPYVGPSMPDNNALRTPASAIDDATLLCTPVVGRTDHLLPPGVTRREGDAESVNNSTRHYRGGDSEDGSVRSSGPLDTTFMQHSEARPSSNNHDADRSSLHHHQDVSAMLDFTEDGDGQLPGSPVIMRRFDGSAGWIDIPKRWLSPLCDREIAQLHAIQTREAEIAARLEVISSPRDAEEGPFLSVGRSRSVADATATTATCSSVTFTRSSALVSSSSSNVATAVAAEPPVHTNPNDSAIMMGVGRRFRGVGRRSKAGRRGERDETGEEEDDVDPRRPSRLNMMMPVNEDCGSPHRPRQQRRRRCEPTVDDKVDTDHNDLAASASKPPVAFRGFATVAYIPTNSIGTPQINRMLSRVALRSTEPRKLGGSYKDKPILSDEDTMNGSAPTRRPRSSASTDRPDPALSARGNYFAFVDVGSDDDDGIGSDGGMLGASTSTVAARHLVFTEGHEEVETPDVLARRLQGDDDDDAADRFTRALQQQGVGDVNTAISRPLFEDDDEQEEADLSPHPLVRMSTLTSDDAPASRGSTQPPEESIGNAPRRSGGGRRSHQH